MPRSAPKIEASICAQQQNKTRTDKTQVFKRTLPQSSKNKLQPY